MSCYGARAAIYDRDLALVIRIQYVVCQLQQRGFDRKEFSVGGLQSGETIKVIFEGEDA